MDSPSRLFLVSAFSCGAEHIFYTLSLLNIASFVWLIGELNDFSLRVDSIHWREILTGGNMKELMKKGDNGL